MQKKILMLVTLLLVTACANMKINPNTLPKGVAVKKGIETPNSTKLALYIPQSSLNSFFYRGANKYEYGKELALALEKVSSNFFSDITMKVGNEHQKFGLFLDINPEWDNTNGKVQLTLHYRVYNTLGLTKLTGKKTQKADYNYQSPETGFYNAAVKATQLMYVDILNKLKPTPESYPALAVIGSIDNELLIKEQPINISTGFAINEQGEVLASHFLTDTCLVIKGTIDGEQVNLEPIHSSQLLDVAVLSSGKATSKVLEFTDNDNLELGQSVRTVSFSNSESKSSSHTLSFGNVSSKEGIQGSFGQFQFSTAIEPAGRGAAVVDGSNRILGLFSNGVGYAYLHSQGILSKNVFIGWYAKIVKRFLDSVNVSYKTSQDESEASVESLVEKSIEIKCYQ